MSSDMGEEKEIQKERIILRLHALVSPTLSEYSGGGSNTAGEEKCDLILRIMKSISGIEQPAAHASAQR